ncbi:hypothetical protein B0J13DRAFT_60334 [Dactylonectria estremocensis]|uniref:Uncharacterized protein n=1 Tax=Dactylonectria estremocensis TaxID=1079267 RepID=A0A9P9EQH8_9HYPO|nr:hypothetical protein B0J13DRAFT_60334 [Dactylonectria estremocensis]
MIRRSQRPTFVLLSDPLPGSGPHSNILGRFVADPGNPADEYAPEDPELTTTLLQEDGNCLLETVRTTAQPFMSAAREDSARAALRSFFSFGAGVSQRRTWRIDTTRVVTRRLANHRRVFALLVRNRDLRAELMDLLAENSGTVYMAIATRSCIDASVEVMDAAQSDVGVMASVPVGAAVAAGVGVHAAAIDPSVEASTNRLADWGNSHIIEGECIFQVEYRIIKAKRPGLFGLGGRSLELQFGQIAKTKWGSGTFNNGVDLEVHDLGGGVLEEDVDWDVDEDIGLLETPLSSEDVSISGALLCTCGEDE